MRMPDSSLEAVCAYLGTEMGLQIARACLIAGVVCRFTCPAYGGSSASTKASISAAMPSSESAALISFALANEMLIVGKRDG